MLRSPLRAVRRADGRARVVRGVCVRDPRRLVGLCTRDRFARAVAIYGRVPRASRGHPRRLSLRRRDRPRARVRRCLPGGRVRSAPQRERERESRVCARVRAACGAAFVPVLGCLHQRHEPRRYGEGARRHSQTSFQRGGAGRGRAAVALSPRLRRAGAVHQPARGGALDSARALRVFAPHRVAARKLLRYTVRCSSSRASCCS